MADPVEKFYDLDDEGRKLLENPEAYDFRSEPVVQITLDKKLGEEVYKFNVDVLNQVVTLLSQWDEAEYSLLEQGDDYTVLESTKHVETDGARPKEISVYYLDTGDETFRYDSGQYVSTAIRIPRVLNEIDLEDNVEEAKNSSSNRSRLERERAVDTPGVNSSGRTIPVSEEEKDRLFDD